jgi:hypothetical protein
MRYIVTDSSADWTPESGKRYFADFDISPIPYEVGSALSLESITYKFRAGMAERGHELKDVVTVVPMPGMIRIFFTPENPPHLIIIVAIAIAIIVSALMATHYLGSAAVALFKGIGEAVTELAKLPIAAISEVAKIPAKVIHDAFENPIATIAIIVAIGLFLLGGIKYAR